MEESARRVVVFPRYTSLVGPATGSTVFRSAPIQARAFSRMDLVTWVGSVQGGTWSFKLETSQDLNYWREEGIIIEAAAGQEKVTSNVALDSEWVRLKGTLSADRFTCWMVADFTLREGV